MTTTTKRTTVCRLGLSRTVPFTFRDAAAGADAGDGFTLDGYGAVFNSVTNIRGWEGEFEEEIAPGAFKKSLRENTPVMQFDHGSHPMIGSIPIGVYSLTEEDQTGLHVVGRLSDNWLIEPVRIAISDRAVKGMSFRFSVVRESWVDANGKTIKAEDVDMALFYPAGLDYEVASPLRRTLKELKCSEVGPVVWPAYGDTSVDVRSTVTIDLSRLTEPGQRSTLARAVFLADQASAAEKDAPPATDGTAADHPAEDAEPVRTVTPPDVHESTPVRPAWQASAKTFARTSRSYLDDIRTE